MEKRSDISKALALVLILLTVIISAASTWVLVTKSLDSEPAFGFNDALVKLHIIKSREPVQTDTNSGDVQIFIAKSKGG